MRGNYKKGSCRARMERRALDISDIIISEELTVRECAKRTGISKSTVYKDLTIHLKDIDVKRYLYVLEILAKHKQMRSHNGGAATKEIYRIRRLNRLK